MKKLLLFLSLAFYLNTNAQTWVTIPDANFSNYLGVLIPAAMNGNQMNTSSTLVTSMTSLNISGRQISDLTGVQYFTSLTYLDCSSNYLTTLPVLPNSLTGLSCITGSLVSLPVLPTALCTLDVRDNAITSLPNLPNTLVYLGCENNHITSIPALPNSLQVLYCYNNLVSSLPVLPGNLQQLYCQNNNIKCFPVFPTSIGSMGIDNNPFNCLPNHLLAMNSNDLATPLCTAGNSNGCAVMGINQITDINNQINLYPNPAQNNFTVEVSNSDKQTLSIFDVNGKQVLSQTIIGKTIVDASNLNAGVYNVSITNNEGVANKKLIIVK